MLTAVRELAELPTLVWIGTAVVGLITLFYVYLTWNFSYWKKQGIQTDRPRPFWGTMSNPMKTAQDQEDLKQYKKYGRIYGGYEGRQPILFVADPDTLKKVLVKDFHLFQDRKVFELPEKERILRNFVSSMRGDEWRHHRNIITPTFTTGKMKQMLGLIEDCAQDLVNYLRKYSTEGKPVEFTQYFQAFTLDVIATCAFGTKIDCLDNPDNEFVKHANAAFNSPPKLIFLIFIFPKLAKYLPDLIPKKTTDYFTNLIARVLERRTLEKNPRRDFLQIIMEAKAEYDKGNLTVANDHLMSTKYPLTNDHIIANSMLFIIAGFETTSATLSIALYSIALHDDVQDKIIREVDDVLEQNKGELNYELIGDMQYIEMVISETLRMHPPVGRLERSVKEDCVFEGIKLEKDFTIGIPTYSMHYDEEFFPEPQKFDPERFSPENKSKRNPYTYLPFGYGPRNCIGMRFAMMEMKIALAYLFKEFRVKTCPTTDIPFIRKIGSAFLKPERINLVLEKRTDAKYS